MQTDGAIQHPATGQQFVFRRTPGGTGDAVVFESFLPPHANGLTPEPGTGQEQRFEVLRGSVGFRVDGAERLLVAGERLTVPRGIACRYWNAAAEPAHLVGEVRPALGFESDARALCARTNERELS